MLIAIAIALAAAPAESWVDPAHQDIPPQYRGAWALDGAQCSWTDGPAFVSIGARTIYFYERYGYLELAQVNELTPPVFYGAFHFAENFRFSRETVRLDRVGEKLAITEGGAPDTPRSKILWHKCGA
jgi:hypothetical protein